MFTTRKCSAAVLDREAQVMQPLSEFRILLPQIIACLVANLIIFQVAFMYGYPTIVIASLLKSKDGLHFTAEQASWFGSLAFLLQPVGSIISAMFIEPHGRKRAILLFNIPQFVAWLLIYLAKSINELYIAVIIWGLGGFFSPSVTYAGEICQPKWRGVLSSVTGFFASTSYFFVVGLAALTDWRTTAGICLTIPILTISLSAIIPESPVWLLSKGRLLEAEKSLCWLRGWVSPEHVKTELQELIAHNNVPSETKDSGHTRRWRKAMAWLHIDELTRRQTLQPLLISFMFTFLYHGTGYTGPRPFFAEIFEELHPVLDLYHLMIIWTGLPILGNVLCILTIKKFGKKKLALFSLGCCCISNFALSGFVFTNPNSESGWIPSVLFTFVIFSISMGMAQIIWIIIGEIFPIRGRTVGSALAITSASLNAFIATKTFTGLHYWLTLPGVFALYGLISFLGCFGIYFLLPDMEGKSLQQIEELLENQYQKFKKTLFKK